MQLYTYPFETVGITALNRYVMEWFPASLDTLFGQLLLAFVLMAVLPTLVFGRRNLRTADALIIVGLSVMAYQAIRFLLITGPIGAAIAAVVMGPIVAQSRVGLRAAPVLSRLSRPRQGALGTLNAALIGVVILIGAGVSMLRVSPPAQDSEIARSMPVGAVRWLDENDPGRRLFNRYEWGGYIGQQRPGELVFMDGRADVYGDDLLQMYVAIIGVTGRQQELLDRYDIDHAVFPPNTPLAEWFDHSDLWERVYQDETSAIWLRR